MEASDRVGTPGNQAESYAVRAQGHYQAASVKMSARMFEMASPYLAPPGPIRDPAEPEITRAG